MRSSPKTSIVLFLLRIVRTSVAVFNLALSAKYFGTNISRDIWILAFNYITVLNLGIWGPLDETFRAKYIFIREIEGDRAALRKTSALFNLTTLISVVIVLGIIILSTLIAKIVAPAFSGENFNTLVFMIQLTAPVFLLTQVTKLWTSILNANNSFYIPEIAGFISAVINLILLVVLAPAIGIYSLVVSAYVGLFILVGMLIYQMNKLKIPLFQPLSRDIWTMAKPFIFFSLPFFMPYFFGQMNGLIEKSLATILGQGKVSILDYAKKFTEIPLGVLTSVLTTVLVPVLSANFAQSNKREFITELKQTLQLGLLVLGILVSMLTVCGRPIVELLYNRGVMTSDSLEQIIKLTSLYSWSAISVFLYLVTGLTLLAVNKGKIYAFFGVVSQILVIAGNLMGYSFWGVNTFAYSLILTHFTVAVFMWYRLPFGKKELLQSFCKYMLLLFAIVGILYGINLVLPLFHNLILEIVINAFLVFALLVSALIVFKLDERAYLVAAIAKLKKRA